MVNKKGSRSLNDGKAWRCRCGNVNQPTKHRFFNLPAFKCSQCQRQCKLNFKFCLGEIKANGKSVIGEVWDQERSPYCVAFAYGKQIEIMERTYNIKTGLDPDTVVPIDPYDLEQLFDEKFSNVHSVDCHTVKVGTHKVLHMGLLLRSEGIEKRKSNDKYIAADVSTIPRDDFELICQTLAEGIPLLATYWAGKRRNRIGYCKMYKSPPEYRYGDKGALHIGHAVVLIGAGRKKGKQFFFFLNSWGKKFCPRKNKKGEVITGGIGKIQEEDLTKNVVKLSYPNETGGGRRLEDQLGMSMSNCNLLLMKAKKKQCSEQRLQNARNGQIQAVSLDDDGIFSDDEGGYSQTPCAIYQGIARAIRSLNCRPAANRKALMNQTSVANERSLMSQVPAANGKPLMSQIPAPNRRPVMSQRLAANGRSQMSCIHVANGQPHMNKILGPEVHPALMAYPAKVADPKLMVDEGKMKELPQKLTRCRSRVTPNQEEVPNAMFTQAVVTRKVQQGGRLLKWLLRPTHATGI